MRLAAAAPLAAALACAPGEDAAADRRDTLVIAVAAEPGSLFPPTASSEVDHLVLAAVGYPLVELRFDCGLVPRPAAAARWSWNADGSELSMELRRGLRWSDGAPFSAEDVALGARLVLDPAVGSPRAPLLARLDPDARPRVLGPDALSWRFVEGGSPTARLVDAATAEPVPAHLLRGVDPVTLRGSEWERAPVVLGRWRVGRWEPGSLLELLPNEAWSGPPEEAPHLRRVVIRVIPDETTRVVELERGAVDLVAGVRPDDARRLAREHPQLRLVRRGWRVVEYVAWNERDPDDWARREAEARAALEADIERIRSDPSLTPEAREAAIAEARRRHRVDPAEVAPHPVLGDPHVRRALALAVDVDRLMADAVGEGPDGRPLGRRATGTVTPALCGAHADLEPLPHDPARAAALLAEAGWVDEDGDGVRERRGRELRVVLEVNRENRRRLEVATAIQAELARVGVAVEVRPADFATIAEDLRTHRFDAVLGGLVAGLQPDLAPVWSREAAFNFSGHADPALDALLARARDAPSEEAALDALHEAQARIYDEQAWLFLWWLDELVAVHERFVDTSIDLRSPWGELHRWRVAPPEP